MPWLDASQVAILGNVLLAMALGAVVGWEREAADKPAGFRTHILVGGAAAMLVAMGDVIVQTQGADNGTIRSDPIRIIEAIVTGVSFLGAGTIIRMGSEGRVEGLTTGASLLFVAAVGISVAIGQVQLAIGATLLNLLVLLGGRLYERNRAPREGSSTQH